MDILFIWSLPVLPHSPCFLTLVLTQGQEDKARCVAGPLSTLTQLGSGVPFAKGATAVLRCLDWDSWVKREGISLQL